MQRPRRPRNISGNPCSLTVVRHTSVSPLGNSARRCVVSVISGWWTLFAAGAYHAARAQFPEASIGMNRCGNRLPMIPEL